jgi:hypothetical protein
MQFPDRVADFSLSNVGKNGQGAAYISGTDDPVTATVRIGGGAQTDALVPALDLGGDDLDTAMARVGIGIRRFYPDAVLVLDEPLYLSREEGLEAGRHQTWRYRDAFLGRMQEVDMDVVINCCTDQGDLVNVWFRHRTSNPIDAEMLALLNELPWN